MRFQTRLLALILLVLGANTAAEELVFARVHESRSYPPRDFTEIHAWRPGAKRLTLLFDDRRSNIRLKAISARMLPPGQITLGGNRLFGYGAPKQLGPSDYFPPSQTIYRQETHRTWIYELTTDGSHGARRVAEVLGTQTPRVFLATRDDATIAYLNMEWSTGSDGKRREINYLYAHDATSGRLQHKVGLQMRCYGCFTGIGWVDNRRIYLWREPEADEHLAPDQDTNLPLGPHVIDVATGMASAIPPAKLEPAGGRHRATPNCAPMEDGGFFCASIAPTTHRTPECAARKIYLYHADPARGSQRPLTEIDPSCALAFSLSPSGRFVAAFERVDSGRQARLVVQDLRTDKRTTIQTLNTSTPNDALHLVGWRR